MTEYELLDIIKKDYQDILGSKLTGIYVHGSLAFGCFRWAVSDIDFLVVVNAPLELREKEALISVLLALDDRVPPKGFEMSVVLESICKPFVYPTPFELHFSNTHKQKCRENLREYCRGMNGTDKDLAAHFTVIHQVGSVLRGKPIEEVFARVPKADYLDSIMGDIQNAAEEILADPVYYILNLCRVLGYLESSQVLSKEQGGLWGAENLSADAKIIRSARDAYLGNTDFQASDAELKAFAANMLSRIQEYI